MNETEKKKRCVEESNMEFSLFSHQYCMVNEEAKPTDDMTYKDQGVQCDPDPLLQENIALMKEVADVKRQLKESRWGIGKISDNDEKTRFYNGLPTFTVFLWLFNFIKPKAERMKYWVGQKGSSASHRQRSRPSVGSLDLIDQLFAVLMRLRLGIMVADISDRFNISEGTFSKYFTT